MNTHTHSNTRTHMLLMIAVPSAVQVNKPAGWLANLLCPVLLCRTLLMICCVSSEFVYFCLCVCAKARTFDWRHATAGSNYKDMKQIVEDCCCMQHWETDVHEYTQKYDKPSCFQEYCRLFALTLCHYSKTNSFKSKASCHEPTNCQAKTKHNWNN